jgi:hypothetical protein
VLARQPREDRVHAFQLTPFERRRYAAVITAKLEDRNPRGGVMLPQPCVVISQSMIAREPKMVRPSITATGTLWIGETARNAAQPCSVAVSTSSTGSASSAATARTRRANGEVVVP